MVNKEPILSLLDDYYFVTKRENITINDDGTIDSDSSVILKSSIATGQLYVEFGRVDGDFECENNSLRSLQGSPRRVGRDFYCQNNQLESLDGAPAWVGKDFDCRKNQLTTLEGAPKYVARHFICNNNPLTSLKGMPDYIGGQFWFEYDPQLPLLRALVAKEGIGTHPDPKYPYSDKIIATMNLFKGQGKRGVPACMVALNNLQKELGIDISANIRW